MKPIPHLRDPQQAPVFKRKGGASWGPSRVPGSLRSRKLIALLGVLIVGLFATVQAVHAHPSGTADESHCSICLAAHATATVVALPSLPVLVLIRAEVPQFAPQHPYIAPSTTPSIRPPPATA